MTQPSIDVPDAELAVLKVLWEDGPATVRELSERLYPDGGLSKHATVQKLLERLEARGCVGRSREGRANVFHAETSREELIRHRLRDAAEKLCEGSFAPLLTQLVDARRLSAQEIAELRAVVARLDGRGRGGKTSGGRTK